ncbi:MAG: hypothetical protein RMJ32_04540 [Aquificaceae bacterium]|nr:hypothetical protein [Aquificaceae bacterium]
MDLLYEASKQGKKVFLLLDGADRLIPETYRSLSWLQSDCQRTHTFS